MEMAYTVFYCDTETITAVKIFMAHTREILNSLAGITSKDKTLYFLF
jgi:hypothetical protein